LRARAVRHRLVRRSDGASARIFFSVSRIVSLLIMPRPGPKQKLGVARYGRFAVLGKNAHPDATFTLRLSHGQAKGYPMNGTPAQAIGIPVRSVLWFNQPSPSRRASFFEFDEHHAKMVMTTTRIRLNRSE
jgi:hypothetical protein